MISGLSAGGHIVPGGGADLRDRVLLCGVPAVTDLPPSLVVSEIFGPTCQRRGPTMGERCGFLRLMGCNLACSWCDTPYTWDAGRFNLAAEGHRMTWAAIVEELIAMDVSFVIVSGGEPLLHQKQAGVGTGAPRPQRRGHPGGGGDQRHGHPQRGEPRGGSTGSPCPPSWRTPVTRSRRIVPAALGIFRDSGRARVLQVRVRHPGRRGGGAALGQALSIHPHYVWIMPEGVTSRPCAIILL
jgi:7-carboxy-7-deazaguanine synthase